MFSSNKVCYDLCFFQLLPTSMSSKSLLCPDWALIAQGPLSTPNVCTSARARPWFGHLLRQCPSPRAGVRTLASICSRCFEVCTSVQIWSAAICFRFGPKILRNPHKCYWTFHSVVVTGLGQNNAPHEQFDANQYRRHRMPVGEATQETIAWSRDGETANKNRHSHL